MGCLVDYLDSSPPLADGHPGHEHSLLLLHLVLLVHDLDHDESKSSYDSSPDQDEHAPHVVEAESGRRVVVLVFALDGVVQKDPAVVQVLHLATWNRMHFVFVNKRETLHIIVRFMNVDFVFMPLRGRKQIYSFEMSRQKFQVQSKKEE